MSNLQSVRSLSEIGREIQQECAGKSFYVYAQPYVEPLIQLNSINDQYYADSAESVVRYALSNLTGWRGEKAKAIKAELNLLLKSVK